jgi:hypothetical protein
MPSLSTMVYWEGAILIGGLFGIVFWKVMTGAIILDHLFEGDIRDPSNADGYASYTSAGRVQSFLISLFAALSYLLQIIHNPRVFPIVPNSLIGVLAGSQALYLGGKAQAMFVGRLRDFLK